MFFTECINACYLRLIALSSDYEIKKWKQRKKPCAGTCRKNIFQKWEIRGNAINRKKNCRKKHCSKMIFTKWEIRGLCYKL